MLRKKKYSLMAGLLSLFMVLTAIISPISFAANANESTGESHLTIKIPRNGKDADQNSPARELKVYKISDENLTSKELEEKRISYDAMTISEVEKEFEPVGETLKSTVEDTHDVIKLENLTPGAYLLKETDESAQNHEYRITSTTTNIQAGIVDVQEINVKTEQHKKVPLVLHKIAYKDESSDLEPIDLEGVTFNLLRKNEDGEEEAINLEKTADGIYTYNEDQGAADLVTNAAGKIEINNLLDGDYFFREIQTIEDYVINEDERDTDTFTYDSKEGLTKKVVNRKEGQRFTIGLHKVDGNTNEDLAGVEFRLYVKAGKDLTPVGIDENGNYDIGNQYTDTFTTNEKGEIAIEGLPELAEANTYVFREEKPLDGYVLNNKNYLVRRNEVVEVKNFKNPTPIELRLNKVDSITNNPIDKVGFELFKVVTNENDDNTAQITEERVGVKGEAGSYEFRDDLAESEIEYQLYTGTDGQIVVSGLPDGEYFFRENQPQKDYNLAENRGKESNRLDRENSSDTMENRPVTPPSVSPPTPNNPYGSYNFVKVDDSKEQKRLAGATFALYKVSEDGKQTPYEVNGKRYTVKSGDNGEFKVENLPYGKYVLRETAAPAGYILDVNPIEFTISKDSKNAEAIMIVNKRNPDRPVTPPVVSPPGTTPPRTTTPPTTRTTVPPVVSPPKTYYVPKDTPGVPRGPLVKTGDIRILVFIAIGLIMILFGNHIVRKEEKTQIGRVPLQ